jgi:hypothetical protein
VASNRGGPAARGLRENIDHELSAFQTTAVQTEITMKDIHPWLVPERILP